MKLLIADDNENMRKMLKNICSHLFYKILECDDGDLAVDIYKDEKPDWVLMDIKMNRMDGIEATKIINEKYPDAKIIVVSQYDDKSIIDAAMNSGAVEFVGKDDLSIIEKIIVENYK
jgi:CheY-like chemotaxis protein